MNLTEIGETADDFLVDLGTAEEVAKELRAACHLRHEPISHDGLVALYWELQGQVSHLQKEMDHIAEEVGV